MSSQGSGSRHRPSRGSIFFVSLILTRQQRPHSRPHPHSLSNNGIRSSETHENLKASNCRRGAGACEAENFLSRPSGWSLNINGLIHRKLRCLTFVCTAVVNLPVTSCAARALAPLTLTCVASVCVSSHGPGRFLSSVFLMVSLDPLDLGCLRVYSAGQGQSFCRLDSRCAGHRDPDHDPDELVHLWCDGSPLW